MKYIFHQFNHILYLNNKYYEKALQYKIVINDFYFVQNYIGSMRIKKCIGLKICFFHIYMHLICMNFFIFRVKEVGKNFLTKNLCISNYIWLIFHYFFIHSEIILYT